MNSGYNAHTMLIGKKLKFSIVAFIAVLGLYFYYTPEEEEHVHYHAGFIVYIDGIRQDYSNYKYMNMVACSEHDTKKSKAEEQIEKAHLHDGVGDVAHVHRNGGKWSDLFKNIGVMLPEEKGIKFYKQGSEIESTLDQEIVADSSIVIVIGDNNQLSSLGEVSLEHIKEVEAMSELCGTP